MKEKKEALIVLSVALPLLCYGGFSFELGGGGSVARSIAIAVSLTFGLLGVIGGLILLFTKTSLGLVESKEPKPIIKEEKKMETNEEEKYVELSIDTAEQEGKEIYSGSVTSEQNYTVDKPTVQVSESIGLMKREKKLRKECNKLTSLLEEADNELRKTQENLETKGWVNSDNGWVIE